MGKFSEEEIKEVLTRLESEYEFSLTERQIKNIAKKLENYKFNTEEEKLLALEYSCKIKNEINNYISFNVHNNNLRKYYSYNTIDYSINRVLDVINKREIKYINTNSYLENNVSYVESLLRLELNRKAKILSLSNN